MNSADTIVITGAAGLVGQNLTALLLERGYGNIVALDKNAANLAILKRLHPQATTMVADLARPGDWEKQFEGAARLFLLQARITADAWEPFQRDTLDSTREVLRVAKACAVPFTVFVGSSVVHSVADDNYTRAKKAQERLVLDSGLPCCVVRPTLMFGWFDPKHLGWLSRFMARVPVFPIPGHGRYARQPLYARDFVNILLWCAENTPAGRSWDIVGQEEVTYIDIIRSIKKVRKLRTAIIPIPVGLFRLLLRAYALVFKNPPFVADQLDALTAGDHFTGDPFSLFDLEPTPFKRAIEETFAHPVYSDVVLERWS